MSLEVLSRDARGATLELRTGGFWALREPSGTVRVFVPGFDTPSDPSAPALPLRRALVEAVVGKKARLVSAEALDLRGFKGLRPSAVGVAEMSLSWDGTVRPGRRAVSAPRLSRGYLPQYVARLGGTVFQGETKSAVVEMTPVRFDGYRQQLVLASRVRVRLSFTGRVSAETGTGCTGRVAPRKATPFRDVLAQLHTRRRGLHAVGFEELFPARQRGMATGQLRLQRQGQAVGFRVEPATGVFGPGSTLLFFADVTSGSTEYSSEVAWELVRSTTGQGMGVVLGTPEGGPAALSPVGFTSFETNRIYQSGLLEAPDVWLWEALVGGNPARTVTLGLTGVETGSAQPAQVTLYLQGGSESGTVQEHHVQVSLNGAVVGDGRFAGKKPYRLSLSLSASQLVEGANSLELLNVGDAGVYSLVFLDKVSVSYPQAQVARGGAFEGTWAQGGTVAVAGLNRSPAVLDVTLAGTADSSSPDTTVAPRNDSAAGNDVAGTSAVKWVVGFRDGFRVGAVPGGGGAPVRGGVPRGAARAADRAKGALDAAGCREPGGLPRDRPAGGSWGRRSRCCCAGRARGSRRGRWRSRRSRRCSGRASPGRRRCGTSSRTHITRGAVRLRDSWCSWGTRATTRGASWRARGHLRCRRCGRRRATCGRCRTRGSRR